MPPNIALDGELWLGRGEFEKCGLLRRKKPTKLDEKIKWEKDWKESAIKFKVFDIMNSSEVFEERMIKLENIIIERNSCLTKLGLHGITAPLELTQQNKVTKDEALKMAKDVISAGGEGIMLRKPGSLYEAKRSKTLYKIKEEDDMECIIVGYKPGSGKYTGVFGLGGLILARIPVETVAERTAYYNQRNSDQISAVDHDMMRENAHSTMTISKPDRQQRVTFGGPRKN